MPRTTSSHTTAAAIGTEMNFDTPKSCSDAAMPANSATLVAALDVSRQAMAKIVGRMPKRSRIRAANPLPVTAPMRAAISCTTTRENVITRIIHKVA